MATVLIIEDEERFRNECASFFERVGWRAFTAENGGPAIEFLKDHGGEVDAIILDRNMPGMSGDKVIEWLYDHYQILDDICVTVLTAYSDYDSAVDALEAGAWQYLSKPLPLTSLLAIMEPGVALKKCHRLRRSILAAESRIEAVQRIRSIIQETLAPDYCQVLFLSQTNSAEPSEDAHLDHRQFIRVLQQGLQPYVAESVRAKVRALDPILEDAGSLMAAPVFANDGLMIGVLDIESREEGVFSRRWIEVLRYCGGLIGTFETVCEARKVKDIALINRELRHRLATSVNILTQQISEARRVLGEQEPPDSPLIVMSRHVGIVSSVLDDLREITREHSPLRMAEVSPYEVLRQVNRGDGKVRVLGPEGPSERLLARADRESLRYCLDCIMQNAFEAIEVRLMQDPAAKAVDHYVRQTVEEDQGCVRIEIEDTGVGFPPEIQERLFLPLFSTKTRRQNDGIGLYSVRRLVQEMGGWVESRSPGEFQGAFFTVLLLRA